MVMPSIKRDFAVGRPKPEQTLPRPPVRSVRGLSVNIVTNHKLVIDKQIVIAVAAIPVLLAESGSHVTVFPRLAPKRTVITAKVETKRREFLLILHGLAEPLHVPASAILLNRGESDALSVNSRSRGDTVFVQGL